MAIMIGHQLLVDKALSVIGFFRLLLAVMVAANHFWSPVANKLGSHPVAAFYIISGYLMSLTVNKTYSHSADGVVRFLVNRALRVFPAYWVVLAMSVVLLYVYPATFGDTYSTMRLPATTWSWIQNVFLLNLSTSAAVISPPAWTLSVEFVFYITIPLILGRSRWTAATWFVSSLIYTFYIVAIGAPFAERYTPVLAASIFFSAGSCMYFFPTTLRPPLWLALALIPLFVVFPLLIEAAGGNRLELGFYGSVLLSVPILASLLNGKSSVKFDSLAGDLAYPVFLSHVMAAGILRTLIPSMDRGDLKFFLLMLPICFSVSGLWLCVERRYLVPVRDIIRERHVGRLNPIGVRRR